MDPQLLQTIIELGERSATATTKVAAGLHALEVRMNDSQTQDQLSLDRLNNELSSMRNTLDSHGRFIEALTAAVNGANAVSLEKTRSRVEMVKTALNPQTVLILGALATGKLLELMASGAVPAVGVAP